MSRFSIPAGGEPPAILLCTLGLTWAVVPEILGFVAPERFDLYRDHPQRDRLRRETALFPDRAPSGWSPPTPCKRPIH